MRNLSSHLRIAGVAAIALAASQAGATPRRPVAVTREGPVRGISSDGIARYLGIPYAAAPIGDLRWRPPQPHERWHGVRDASSFAGHCAQGPSPFGLASLNEDCLYLNVFTPARGEDELDDWWEEEDDDDEGELRPVMVWIHGGALLVGESDDYDPVRLVRRGVVVV